MNIKQNIVCIKTATQMGTGIILPCENKKNEFGRSNYIILTINVQGFSYIHCKKTPKIHCF